jgi:RHS repeat-associated protein
MAKPDLEFLCFCPCWCCHQQSHQNTTWDYRMARYYDADIGRFLGVDPLAVQAPVWSSYRYAFDNPVLFVDLNGLFETDFGLAKNGHIIQIGPTNNEPDRLFALHDEARILIGKPQVNFLIKPITIKDKTTLPNLTKLDPNYVADSYWGRKIGSWSKVNNSADAFNLFKFSSDNSDAEWGLQKYSNNRFVIGTNHFSETVASLNKVVGYSILDLQMDYHSHPGTSLSDDMASGTDGDQGHASWIVHQFLNAGIDYKMHPKFRIYRPDTRLQYRFDYSPWQTKFNQLKVRTFKDLK